jgi:hypothetical protein
MLRLFSHVVQHHPDPRAVRQNDRSAVKKSFLHQVLI